LIPRSKVSLREFLICLRATKGQRLTAFGEIVSLAITKGDSDSFGARRQIRQKFAFAHGKIKDSLRETLLFGIKARMTSKIVATKPS
jgi:hypothetical protein